MTRKQLRSALELLLHDYGYSYAGDGQLIENAIRGFTSARIVRHKFRDIYDAVEYLMPIIRADSFIDRYNQLTKQNQCV
jgi:hypothetical protein